MRAGSNVGLGRDHTLFAMDHGHVKFRFDKVRPVGQSTPPPAYREARILHGTRTLPLISPALPAGRLTDLHPALSTRS
jgi:hypothetical protein